MNNVRTKNFSDYEIKKRTDRLHNARLIRSCNADKKDEVLVFMIGESYNGFTISQLEKWGIFKYSFLRNALRRLAKQNRIRQIKEFDEQNQRMRFRYFPNGVNPN